MFSERQIESRGLTLAEMTVVGGASAALMLLLDCLCAVINGRGFWTPLYDWPTLRDVLGVAVGVPVFGLIARKSLGLSWFGQLIAMMTAIVGFGQLLARGVEALARWFLYTVR